MKPSMKDVEFMFDKKKNLIGVNLGWDFTAEHELGISKIKDFFGIKNQSTPLKKVFGIQNREINLVPEHLFFAATMYDKKKCYVLALPNICSTMKFNKNGFLSKDSLFHFRLNMWQLTSNYEDSRKPLAASWDEKSFAIATTEENKDKLETIYNALLNKDAIILFAGSDNPFANSGLCIFIKSKLPQSFIDMLYEADKEDYELQKAVNKTKIVETLKKAHKEYYALEPRFFAGVLKFWLNPKQQNKYNSGWFTVEELTLWTKDEGPIMNPDS